ncbi:MAG: DUF3152 domain-containing protein, partial [Acidimicrobiia bacterium]|nr:DUF3152 domain-containing protein [Acidimicrobiia bacterium]
MNTSLNLQRPRARSALALAVALTLFPATASQASVPTSECSIGADNPTGSLVVVGGSSTPFGGTSVRTFTVEVEDGIGLDGACLAEQVQNVLGDPRSWIHQGDLGWQRVDSNPDLRIIFSSPDLTDRLCAPLNTGGIYSCRNGNRTMLNTYRWRSATPEYQSDLPEYRSYQINHEVGHFLGHGHTTCPGVGTVAPVMMQQTKGLDGCEMNGWPYPAVEVVPEVWSGLFKDDDNSTFEADIEWIADRGITLGCNPPTNDRYCPTGSVTRGQMAAFLDRALDLPTTDVDFFPDDNGSTFESSINRLASAGITYGCQRGASFCADQTITRQGMAALLHRSPLTIEPTSPGKVFTDLSDAGFVADIEWLS